MNHLEIDMGDIKRIELPDNATAQDVCNIINDIWPGALLLASQMEKLTAESLIVTANYW